MATVTFKTTSNKIEATLQSMVSKAKNPIPFLRRVIYPMYQQAQLNRWQTENSSETGQWMPLNTKYSEDKKRRYAGFPGGGNAIMIATGKLSKAAFGQTSDLKRVITTSGMILTIDDGSIPYAKYAALKRPFMTFGGNTIGMFQDAIRKWMLNK